MIASINVHAFLSSAVFFQYLRFWKILSGILSECQTIRNQIRPDVLSGLIWVQTVCKCYQQTTLVDKDFCDYFSNYQYLSKSIRAISEDNGTFYSLSNPILLNKLFNTISGPHGVLGSGENGYLFSGSSGALVIILGELGSKLIILRI